MSEFLFVSISPWSSVHGAALALQIGLGLLLGLLEASGRFHLPFGKFRREKSAAASGKLARVGLTLSNLAPILVYIGGYWYYGAPVSPYHNLLLGAFILIFGKRTLEAAFLHRYSSGYSPTSLMGAALAWSVVAYMATTLHNDYTSVYIVYDRPFRLLGWWGFGVLVLGIFINSYHYFLLARSRKVAGPRPSAPSARDEPYGLPRGGLFRFVVCPHYLGDILIWFGFALMSRHVAMYGIAFIVTAYLAGRSHRTLLWYRARLESPPRLKSLVPFVF